MEKRTRKWGVVGLAMATLVLLLGASASAQVVKGAASELDNLTFGHPGLRVSQQIAESGQLRAELGERAAALPLLTDYDTFLTREGGRWQMQVDRSTGRAALVEGSGIPWIPGSGNTLTGRALGLAPGLGEANDVPVEFVAERALDMVRAYPELFGAAPEDLELVDLSSGPMLDYLYYVHFAWRHKGVPVENATLVFRLNSGNLVQFGSEGIDPVAVRRIDPVPSLTTETAWQILWGYLGGPRGDETVLEKGGLSILPLATPQAQLGLPVEPGTGLEYRLAYTLRFRREGDAGTWEAKVDAHTGEVLSFLDANRYGNIHGGAYPGDRPTAETNRPFPFADTGLASPNNYADAGGLFTGTSATSTLNGKYVQIQDKCGALSLSTTTGDINFGSGSGTDCTTPGVGGAGNTHAARTQYYQVTLIKMKALTYMPTNTWLAAKLLDRTNLTSADSSYCPGNAWWDGTQVNFCVGSSSYGNTGELPGVSLHEWAHGLDSYDGSPSGDNGTGETYGDFSGTLQTHGSCVGNGFYLSGADCSGYGDGCLSCAGIRQIDWDMHASHKPHFPEDLTSNTCTGCTSFTCSASSSYAGPCGREGHCESLVSSEAMWDLPVRDLVTWGMDVNSAWQLMDKLWYASRPTSGSAYACPSVTTANGCGTSNYFTTFRVVDDCDGNLANGTPHASAIYAAFNRHKIACTTAVNTDNNCGCATLATPVLAGTPGNNSNTLTWGAVSGASSYDVYRNDAGCSAGYTKIGNTAALSFTDGLAVNGVTYTYRLQANGSGACPPSPMSNCVTLTPVSCTTPGTPTLGSVTVPGNNQLQVSWTAGSPAGSTYRIYRAVLSDAGANCTTGSYTFLATDTASPYVDNTVSGTVTYGYRVAAVDSTGGCESAQSGCAKNTATGTCTMGPIFGGITGVTNPASATCTLNLAWTAATAFCGGPVTYSVYRSTTYPFTPGTGNRIASGLAGTGYVDDVGLVSGTTYYYTVRATDSANGASESNTVTQAGVPTGPYAVGTWSAGAEAGHPALTLQPPWAASTTYRRSGSASYFSGYSANSCAGLVTPALTLSSSAVLTFYQLYSIETGWDGGRVEISENGGASWVALTPSPAYPGTLSSTGSPPANACSWTSTTAVYTGDSSGYPTTWQLATVAIPSTYNNKTVLIRWEFSTDPAAEGGGANPGWYIDDITLTNVQLPGTCTTGTGGCTAPGAPNLTSATGTCSGVDLAWSAGTGTTQAYNVYRVAGACGGAYTKIAGPVAGTAYSDTTAVAGTSYAYVVRGTCDAGGATESPNSNCRTATRSTTPAAPTGVSAVGGCAGVTVSWTNSAGATRHDVVRGTACGTALTTFTNVTSPYQDTTAVAGTTYNYWVVAANACGTGANSACATAARLVSPTPTVTGDSANTCPATTVLLTTQAGMSAYQWYAGGSPIPGANASTYTAAASGSYTVSYTAANGCSGTSAAKAVTVSACAPNVVYSANGPWAQVASMGNDDGVVDPGESWEVGVTLTNAGTSPATGVHANLSAAGATLCTGAANYGTLAPGGSATGTFRFTVDGAAACGASLTFNVIDKASAEGTYPNEVGAFQRTVGTAGGGTPANYPQTGGLPLAIPDNTTAGVASEITLGGAGTLADLHVNLGVTHTYVGDLLFTLTHVETGTSATFIDRPGYTGSGYGCSGNDIAATLDDAAASPVESQCAASAPAIGGTFSPNAPLAVFNGESLAGTWRLTASDRAPGDTGSVTSWSLDITTAGSVCHAWSGSNCLPVPPDEVAPGQSLATALVWNDKTTQVWPAAAGATGYRVYRGVQADLQNGNILTAADDSCTRFTTDTLSTGDVTDDPSAVAGGFYWYIVTGYNGAGEGPAGNATDGARVLNSTGACP